MPPAGKTLQQHESDLRADIPKSSNPVIMLQRISELQNKLNVDIPALKADITSTPQLVRSHLPSINALEEATRNVLQEYKTEYNSLLKEQAIQKGTEIGIKAATEKAAKDAEADVNNTIGMNIKKSTDQDIGASPSTSTSMNKKILIGAGLFTLLIVGFILMKPKSKPPVATAPVK